MNALEDLKNNILSVEEKLGYVFENKDYLILSLVHRSFVNEYKAAPIEHNERLEFLGDSVLGLIMADYLYHRLPSYPEGQLSQLRSRLVDSNSCANYLQKLALADFILLGRGEKITEGRSKQSIQADVFEAIIGAIYLDGGLSVAKSFFICHFEEEINQAIGSPPRNYKAELQDYSQKKFQKTPIYKVVEESGPDHSKIFHVMVFIDDKQAGLGIGASKKEAEQRAAFDAISKIPEVSL
ncbi:MAG: ribonuclease III [Verrucomicrobia bacterium]|nr:ribonuclease III [Verrucomicrobiota bacterium]